LSQHNGVAGTAGLRLPARAAAQPAIGPSRPRNRKASMAIAFEIVPMPLVDALEALWRELEARSEGGFFLSWDWVGCWIEETGLKPAILIGRQQGRVVLLAALVPTRRHDIARFAIAGMHLQTIGDLHQDIVTIEYNGFLLDRTLSGWVQQQAVGYLLTGPVVEGRRRNELHLKNVTVPYDINFAETGARCIRLGQKPSWRVDLDAIRASGKAYLDHLSPNTRQQIRRSMRLYEREGKLVAQRARDVPEALRFLEELKELHQRTWTRRGETGSFAFPFFERFQRRLIATCLPRGTVEIIRVTCGERVIGYLYNFVWRGTVLAYQSGLAYEADARLKPGLVAHCLAIDSHLAEGAKIYDFMAGEARYKASLGEPGPEMYHLLLQRPTWALRLEFGLRNLKRALGLNWKTASPSAPD
jgi:CelD/BcsL family acetyltransferase involved in cellulose biosynthesis